MASSVAHILAESGLLDANTADAYVQRARQSGVRVVDLLERERVASGDDMRRCISATLGIPPIQLTQIRIQGYIAKILAQADAERLLAIPVSVKREGDQDVLFVAVADPCAEGLRDELEHLTKRSVKLAVASPDDIRRAIERTYGRRSGRSEASAASVAPVSGKPDTAEPPMAEPEENPIPFAALEEAPAPKEVPFSVDAAVEEALDFGDLTFDPTDGLVMDTASGVYELNTHHLPDAAPDERRSSAPIVETEALVPKKGEWIRSTSDFAELHVGEASDALPVMPEAVSARDSLFETPLPAKSPSPTVLLEDALGALNLDIPEAPAFAANASGLTNTLKSTDLAPAPLIEKLEAEMHRPPAPLSDKPAEESEWSLNINALLTSRPTPVETPILPAPSVAAKDLPSQTPGDPMAAVMSELDRLLDESDSPETPAPTLDASSIFDLPAPPKAERPSDERPTDLREAERRPATESDDEDDDAELRFIHDLFVGRASEHDPRRARFPRAVSALERAMAAHPDLDEASFIDTYFSS